MTPRFSTAFTQLMALAWLGLSGCGEEAPPPTPGSTAGPAAQTAEIPSRQEPASSASTRQSPPAPSVAPSITNPVVTGRPPPVGRPLDLGRADAPSYLRIAQPGWEAAEAVQIVDPKQLDRLVSPDALRRLQHFAVQTAAAVRLRRIGSTPPTIVRVLAIEARSPADAYGLTTCGSSSPIGDACGGLSRVEIGPGLTYHTWQGTIYLQVAVDRDGPNERELLRQLVLEIVGRVPAAETPAVVRALPLPGAAAGRSWLVRHLDSLPVQTLGIASPTELGQMSKLLGLGETTLAAIASYDAPMARQPDTVWVVEYPSAGEAKKAAARLEKFLRSSPSTTWRNVLVGPPHGRYVFGTWTAEEESLLNILPKLQAALPG